MSKPKILDYTPSKISKTFSRHLHTGSDFIDVAIFTPYGIALAYSQASPGHIALSFVYEGVQHFRQINRRYKTDRALSIIAGRWVRSIAVGPSTLA